MIRIIFSVLMGLALAGVPAMAQDRSADAQQPPPIQARPGGPEGNPRTDQTVDVAKGTRLVLSNNAGEVVVRSWDREQVRVQATHSERDRIDIQNAENTLRIRARTARGPASLVDYQITVPRWMPVNLSGTYLESTIDGTTAEVTVECRTSSLAGAYKVLVEGAGVTAEVVTGKEAPKAADPKAPPPVAPSCKLTVTVTNDAPLGVREFRIASSLGISSLGQLVVVDAPVVAEKPMPSTMATGCDR